MNMPPATDATAGPAGIRERHSATPAASDPVAWVAALRPGETTSTDSRCGSAAWIPPAIGVTRRRNTSDPIREATVAAGEACGVPQLGKAQAPVRLAVTGRSVGPPLFESLELLGRDRTIGRLVAARSRLAEGETGT